jgi:hypothetical protein
VAENVKTVRQGFMPPPEADAMPDEARAGITRWVRSGKNSSVSISVNRIRDE